METELKVTEDELKDVAGELMAEFGHECPQVLKDIAEFKTTRTFGLAMMVSALVAPKFAETVIEFAFANGVIAGLKLGRKQATAELTEVLISPKEDHRERQTDKPTDNSTTDDNK